MSDVHSFNQSISQWQPDQSNSNSDPSKKMMSTHEGSHASGTKRALQLIEELCHSSPQNVPASFAKIIVGLFPEWFDFASDKFAVMAWRGGLHLVISGSEYGFGLITTSDSRCLSCLYVGETMEVAGMHMHYSPFPEQIERAKNVVILVLHRLFPGRGEVPVDLARLVPPDRTFPSTWNGQVLQEPQAPIEPVRHRPWWKIW